MDSHMGESCGIVRCGFESGEPRYERFGSGELESGRVGSSYLAGSVHLMERLVLSTTKLETSIRGRTWCSSPKRGCCSCHWSGNKH